MSASIIKGRWFANVLSTQVTLLHPRTINIPRSHPAYKPTVRIGEGGGEIHVLLPTEGKEEQKRFGSSADDHPVGVCGEARLSDHRQMIDPIEGG